MRDLNTLQRKGLRAQGARRRVCGCGAGASAAVDQDAPALPALGLVRRQGADVVDEACRRALDAEFIEVELVERMCSRGAGEQLPLIPARPAAA